MPRRPPSLRHRAVIARRRLLGEIRHLQAAEKLLVQTLRALSVEGAALQAVVAAESGAAPGARGCARPAAAPTAPTTSAIGAALAAMGAEAAGASDQSAAAGLAGPGVPLAATMGVHQALPSPVGDPAQAADTSTLAAGVVEADSRLVATLAATDDGSMSSLGIRVLSGVAHLCGTIDGEEDGEEQEEEYDF
ncbi:hypothetical protein BU14_0275s0021 [Porphyra umbilicalis]|uniref:Uncharacterized protein n=1 Tax=Porphyra umbilicalis TaxID=2786 RepID=A0A1X6P1C1_PORUM|nr:hypothetical protein BU14_0275s0021 [Porphyra umbilicalis]|eukprot:OSX74662.1 hypothetical protein BU14_0275s0021 [Porphyra umbilicalis]